MARWKVIRQALVSEDILNGKGKYGVNSSVTNDTCKHVMIKHVKRFVNVQFTDVKPVAPVSGMCSH